MDQLDERKLGNPVVQGILVLVVLVLFSWFILSPKYAATQQTGTQLKNAQSQLAKTMADQSELNRLINDLHSAPEDVALLDEALPLNDRVTQVNLLLQSLVQSSGMTLAVANSDDSQKTISAGDKELLANPFQANRKLHTITLSVSVTGTMEQLKNLLSLMETNGRVLDVESLQINGGDPITKFSLTVKAYAYEPVAK